MKIHGQSGSEACTAQVEIPRPDGDALVLTLRPLPLGFHRRLRERHVVPPTPPTRVVRDSGGKPVRDENGLAVVTADDNDSQYLSDLELYHQRVAVLAAAESLKADPHVEFETQPPASPEDWPQYADALYREFERAGWSPGDLIRLCDEICRLSNLVDDHLRETRRNFSSRAARPGS